MVWAHVVRQAHALTLLVACLEMEAAEQPSLTLPLPPHRAVADSSAIRCTALAESVIEDQESGVAPDHSASRLRAKVQKGLDSIVLNISGDKLHFLTRAAFESGVAAGTVFDVVVNDGSHLIATHMSTAPIPMLNGLVINKKEGLAVWTKTRSNSVFSRAPDVAAMYLVCE